MKTISIKNDTVGDPKLFSNISLIVRTDDDYDIVFVNKDVFNDIFNSSYYDEPTTFWKYIKPKLAIKKDFFTDNLFNLEVKTSFDDFFNKITQKYSSTYYKLFGTHPKIITKVEGTSIEDLFFNSEIMLTNLLIVWNIGLIEVVNEIKEDFADKNLYQRNINYLKDMLDILNSKYNHLWFNNMIILNEDISKNDDYNRLINKNILLNDLKDLPTEDLFELPTEPSYNDINFHFFENIFTSKKRKDQMNEEQQSILKNRWNIECEKIKNINIEIEKLNIVNYSVYKKFKDSNSKDLTDFEFEFKNRIVTLKRTIKDYSNNRNIELYFFTTIANSIIEKYFKIDADIQYINETKILIIDFSLPTISVLPKTKDFKYLKTKDQFVEKEYNPKELNTIYNEFIYKVVFRVLNDICNSDTNSLIETISFNGWINSINPKNGKFENKCILTLSAKKQSILDINIEQINPYDAFKGLKGISAVQLSEYTAIAPILNINKEDKRFVQSEAVLKNISNSTNIAAIGWEEFEHLIRELFEKEFEVNGGEVKVTQTSRDGGVDAVAFDPDPIRGGKIVIQSKRYTNVVGVSAVRDLYGTVMNEGATKGILVTTSYYGSDAYEFAKDKPITLIDGSGLLSLLQKHSFNARIDLNEAKKINKENNISNSN